MEHKRHFICRIILKHSVYIMCIRMIRTTRVEDYYRLLGKAKKTW